MSDTYDQNHEQLDITPETPGVDTITGVTGETAETPGVDTVTGVTDTSNEPVIKEKERTYQAPGIQMNLHAQPQKNYNVFNTVEEGWPKDMGNNEQIMLLQFSTSMEIEEQYINMR